VPAVPGGRLRPGATLSQAEVALAAVIAVLPPVDIVAGPRVRALIEVGALVHLACAPVRLRPAIVRPLIAVGRPLAGPVGRRLRALVAPGTMIAGVAVEWRSLKLRGRSAAARRPVVRGRLRRASRAVQGLPVRVARRPYGSAVGRVRGRFKLPTLLWVPRPVGISALVRVRAPLGLPVLPRLRQRRKLLVPARRRQRLKPPQLARLRQRFKLPVLGRLRQWRKRPGPIWIPLPLGIVAVVPERALPRLAGRGRRRQRQRLAAIVRILVLPDLAPLV
jgi:hypothetical protein